MLIDCFTEEIRNYVATIYQEIQLFFELNISIVKSIIPLIDRRYYNLRMALYSKLLKDVLGMKRYNP
ncbi:hypothetical protein IU405_12955 [Polaribacter sp. BAL334]|uniref:hypothetical protein n=1 Tax=Polaribacter sp. BAL334 TaxID=1708178 RepID=UPI0018D22BCB|nr:hypothetical protein [Polaribacter sp. BAL334]MBG7613156.1 hypothetical protein [Polaribacter sp. BAL334]